MFEVKTVIKKKDWSNLSSVRSPQVHRVMLPPAGDSSTRQSLAFFVQPDDDAVITCCDGSNKYPPVTGGGYLQERFKASYGAKWMFSNPVIHAPLCITRLGCLFVSSLRVSISQCFLIIGVCVWDLKERNKPQTCKLIHFIVHIQTLYKSFMIPHN